MCHDDVLCTALQEGEIVLDERIPRPCKAKDAVDAHESLLEHRLLDNGVDIDLGRKKNDSRHNHHDNLDSHGHGKHGLHTVHHIGRAQLREDAEGNDHDGRKDIEHNGCFFPMSECLFLKIRLFMDRCSIPCRDACQIGGILGKFCPHTRGVESPR